jgi:competence protein ComEA
MKKKYIIVGVSCVILLISGICYSCAYKKDNSSVTLISDLSGEDRNTEVADTTMSSEPSEKAIGQAEDPLTNDAGNELKGVSEAAVDGESDTKDIYVHLCGAVLKPGVYQVSVDSRVIDLITLAGGLTEEAAGDYINQAQQVIDGQRIYIPNNSEVKELSLGDYITPRDLTQTEKSSTNRLININTANAEELMELPGVGEAKAASIIEYRTTNGNFQKIEDLMKIPGIKEGLFNQVSSGISVK